MNNIFNIKRFGLVFRKDIMESWKRYTLMFMTMLGIITVVLVWQYYIYYEHYEKTGYLQTNINQAALVSLSLMFGIFGVILASTFMSPMNSKLKRITYLLSPSSHFEKYLTRWLIITVGYIISFFVALWAADSLRVALLTTRFPEFDIAFVDLSKLAYADDSWYKSGYLFPKPAFILILSLYFLVQSLFILGSTFWEKLSFVKTFTAIVLIIILYILICRWAILFFYDGLDGFGNVLNSFEPVNKDEFDEKSVLSLISSIISAFTLSLWTLAFFRFRESAIINKI